MREIKFRGWDKYNSRMVDLKKITPLAVNLDILKIDGLFIPFSDDIILMQYTGIKDKNGVEIYEGDIVKITNCECTGYDNNENEIWQDCRGQILFEDGMFVFEGHSAGTLPMSAYWKEFEVKGNIYQSPELLK